MSLSFDVVIIGAGAAGMMCAAQAGQRGRRVLLLDHAPRIGERIRISGGGRCNFTNLELSSDRFLSRNPPFVQSSLHQFDQHDFIRLVQQYRIPFHEKTQGQLFCSDSSRSILEMLKAECALGNVQWSHPFMVSKVEHESGRFMISGERMDFVCSSLVIATGGLSKPSLGASSFGYRIANQFGLAVVPPRPGLVPLVWPEKLKTLWGELSGTSMYTEVSMDTPKIAFGDSLLLTHQGLSGPAILQISNYWQSQPAFFSGQQKRPVRINLLPDRDVSSLIDEHRFNRSTLSDLLKEALPRRFVQAFCQDHGWTRPLAEYKNSEIRLMKTTLTGWEIFPSGTSGFEKAEVTLGGVDTRELSSSTMESRTCPGLYFIGEVVDVTGWLGGYNFQWAWSSGWVAGQSV